MNVDTYIRQLAPVPPAGLGDPESHEAQMILRRVTHPVTTAHPRRPVVRGALTAGALGAAAALGLVISGLSTSAPPRPTARHGATTVLRLASYRLQLPGDYRLTAAATSDCPSLGVSYSQPASTQPGRSTSSPADVPQYASQVATQANAEGGCIAMVLAPPYTPTAASPDPEATNLVNAQAVQVGPYQGLAGTSTLVAKPSGAETTLEWLHVEIPLAGGQQQDLVVSSTGLSQSALVTLVAHGLSVAPTADPTESAAVLGTSTT